MLLTKLFFRIAGLKSTKIHQADGKIRLLRQVEAEIRFMHGGSGMVRHRRMPVDAKDLLSASRGEEIAEEQEPAQVGRSYPDGNRFSCEYSTADLQRATDAAPMGAESKVEQTLY